MECDHQFVSTTKKRQVTAQGIVGVLGVLAGVLCLLANPILGVVIIIASALIAMIGRNKTVIMCAKCGELSPAQPQDGRSRVSEIDTGG